MYCKTPIKSDTDVVEHVGGEYPSFGEQIDMTVVRTLLATAGRS